MPNIKSAKKRLITSEKARVRNVAERTRIKKVRKAFIDVAGTNDKEVTDKTYRTYCSVLDKAVKHGVIKKNTASRRKARAANKLRAMA
ncbi:MAG: 30S ribosomal protein S20 [Spartobacteria bacterium]|nr:30S ribosomal protein S20 [Spartobacteria bacterium]